MLSCHKASILSRQARKLACMSYGKRLDEALKRAGKERRELAAELGLSVQAVGQVITGGRSGSQRFNSENSAKAARFLRIDPHWLATGEGSMQSEKTWPFALLQPEQIQMLSAAELEMVEKYAIHLLDLKRQHQALQTEPQTAPSTADDSTLEFELTTRRKKRSGTSVHATKSSR